MAARLVVLLNTSVALCTPPAAVAESAFVAEMTPACARVAVLLSATVVDATTLCANWVVLLNTVVAACTPLAAVVESASVADITLLFKTVALLVALVVATLLATSCSCCGTPQLRTKRKTIKPTRRMRIP